MIHASLFSGIGGPEVAAAMLGWENAFHCEINPFGRAVLEYWFPNSISYEDITKTNFSEWRGRIDVLTGGFPCQPFSYAGKRGGAEDSRYLWPEMLRVIGEVRPTWVVGENVAGVATMVEGGILTEMGSSPTLFEEGDVLHRYRLEQSYTIERICRDIEGIGYTVQPMLIPAAAVGAPHRRDRVFIIAFSPDTDCTRLQTTGAKFKTAGDRRARSFWYATDPEDMQCDGGDIGHGREFGRRAVSELGNGCWKDGLRPEQRWTGFPTVSPVHRGNDGIPFDVDRLTVPPMPGPPTYGKGDPKKYPFGKWRTESLKAYGNAIVPQVMYRIFQAIEEVTK